MDRFVINNVSNLWEGFSLQMERIKFNKLLKECARQAECPRQPASITLAQTTSINTTEVQKARLAGKTKNQTKLKTEVNRWTNRYLFLLLTMHLRVASIRLIWENFITHSSIWFLLRWFSYVFSKCILSDNITNRCTCYWKCSGLCYFFYFHNVKH